MENKYKGRYKYKNTWDYGPKRYDAIRAIYRDQLKKFERIGLYGVTEFGTRITPELVRITQKRYDEVKKLTIKSNKRMVSEAEKSVLGKTFLKDVEVAEHQKRMDRLTYDESSWEFMDDVRAVTATHSEQLKINKEVQIEQNRRIKEIRDEQEK
jgi:hypothetical protein